MPEQTQASLDTVKLILTTYGLNVLGALLILFIGMWFAGRVRVFVLSVVKRYDEIDPTLGIFLASLARYTIIIVTVLAVLAKFGFETTSLLAVMGAAGLAIGLALQGTLSNLAAGVMLMIFRPIKIGDFVEVAGLSGTVKGVSLFITELATGDNIQQLVPNGMVWGSAITNYSAHSTRRVSLIMGIAYDADIDKALSAIQSVIASDERIHSDPEPFAAVSNLGDSSVDITIRVWADSSDHWGVKFDLNKTLKERFDADGIDIPFPTQTIHQVSS